MFAIAPVYECKPDGQVEPVMEHICHCGKDVRIHASSCGGFTIAKTKMHRVPMFGPDGQYCSFKNVYVLCRWHPPGSWNIEDQEFEEQSLDEWVDQMGTEADYPRNGRYIPVSKGPHLVVVPQRTPIEDLPECAQLMVHMLSEQYRRAEEFAAKKKEKDEMLRMPIEDAKGNVIREPHKDAPFWRIKDRVKEKMRSFNPTGTVGYAKTLEKETKVDA